MTHLITRLTLLFCLAFPAALTAQKNKAASRSFYQLTVYHFKTAEQQALIDQYVKDALLPALHKMNIPKVGVFTAMTNDTAVDKKLYVFMPVKSLEQVSQLPAKLAKDNSYQLAGKAYLDAPYTKPPYTRMENILLIAFPEAPSLALPQLTGPRNERVYELRSYEGHSEKIHQNKVKMFNEGGEVRLFKRLNFNAIFYGEVIAGAKMPNLMYMTSFENMDDRNAHWKSFSADPEWKILSARPDFQNNVAKNEMTFLKSTPYSDY